MGRRARGVKLFLKKETKRRIGEGEVRRECEKRKCERSIVRNQWSGAAGKGPTFGREVRGFFLIIIFFDLILNKTFKWSTNPFFRVVSASSNHF